jgi:hypothetical protein
MRAIIVAPWILAACAATGCSRQESAWHDALREDTVAAYQVYLDRFPAGAHAAEASASISALRESDAWSRAERLGTPEAWQRYLGEWPDGRHAWQARRLLVDFIPPAPAPAAAFEVQLGAWSDETLARAGLERIVHEHAGRLAGVEARLASPLEAGDALWRLRAGPLPEPSARALCAEFKSAGADCVTLPALSAGDATP